jgi:hypothetical protein
MVPEARTTSQGWSRSDGSTLRTIHSLEAETRLFERLWLVPGVALTTAGASTDNLDLSTLAFTPHLGLAWDATGDRRTWLRASAHQRVAPGLEALVRSQRSIDFGRRCFWDADTATYSRSCVDNRDHPGTVGLPCGPTNLAADGAPCGQPLRLARAWELSMGLERALVLGTSFRLDVVYRRSADLPVIRETNQVWNGAGNVVTGYQTGRAEIVRDYSSDPDGRRRYLGVTAAIQKQTGPLRLLLAHTWSRHREQYALTAAGAGFGSGSVSAEIPAADDRTHSTRFLASYDILGYAAVGTIFAFDTGLPYQRFFVNDTLAAYTDYRARLGINPGTNLNDPADDRPTRYPDVMHLDLQLRGRARRLVGIDADLYIDVLNVLGSKTVTSLGAPGTSFVAGPPPPARWWRVGLAYRY